MVWSCLSGRAPCSAQRRRLAARRPPLSSPPLPSPCAPLHSCSRVPSCAPARCDIVSASCCLGAGGTDVDSAPSRSAPSCSALRARDARPLRPRRVRAATAVARHLLRRLRRRSGSSGGCAGAPARCVRLSFPPFSYRSPPLSPCRLRTRAFHRSSFGLSFDFLRFIAAVLVSRVARALPSCAFLLGNTRRHGRAELTPAGMSHHMIVGRGCGRGALFVGATGAGGGRVLGTEAHQPCSLMLPGGSGP